MTNIGTHGPKSEQIKKLAAVPSRSLAALLLLRGIPEESIQDTLEGLEEIGTPITVEDAVAWPFKPDLAAETPYRYGQFSDGREYPVYYAALDRQTCLAEIAHHLQTDIQRTGDFPRFYFLIESAFSGEACELVGLEQTYPDLTSQTETGYPFCQELARGERARGSTALQTRSARDPNGVCVPVFSQQSITLHQKSQSVRLSMSEQGLQAVWLTS